MSRKGQRGPDEEAVAEALGEWRRDLFSASGVGLLAGLDMLAESVGACHCSSGYALILGDEALDAYAEILVQEGLEEMGLASRSEYLGLPIVGVSEQGHANRGVLFDPFEWCGAGASLL